jgi:hypothetical protein
MRGVKWLLTVMIMSTAGLLLFIPTALAGVVLPATARPEGWSLARMTSELALFTTSGNEAAYYPKTPFQILYADAATSQVVPVGDGFLALGSNSFAVRPGTAFFVPLWNADDSPPIVGTWPENHSDAIAYFFDPTQVGGKGFAITIDGRTTPIGAAYLAGPVTTPPLLDGGGTHIITLGAFLTPLPSGTHTVSISGGVFGSEIAKAYPFSFIEEDISYTVSVEK